MVLFADFDGGGLLRDPSCEAGASRSLGSPRFLSAHLHIGRATADRKWKVAKEMVGRRLSQAEREEVVGQVGIRAVCPGYEELIGAKKHLVLGLLTNTGPGSNSFATGL